VKLFGRAIDSRVTSVFEIDPANVGAVGEAAQLCLSVRRGIDNKIHAKVIRGTVRVLNMIDRVAVAHVDPTDIGAVNKTGAGELPDDDTVSNIALPVHEPDVRAPTEGIGWIDRRVSPRHRETNEK